MDETNDSLKERIRQLQEENDLLKLRLQEKEEENRLLRFQALGKNSLQTVSVDERPDRNDCSPNSQEKELVIAHILEPTSAVLTTKSTYKNPSETSKEATGLQLRRNERKSVAFNITLSQVPTSKDETDADFQESKVETPEPILTASDPPETNSEVPGLAETASAVPPTSQQMPTSEDETVANLLERSTIPLCLPERPSNGPPNDFSTCQKRPGTSDVGKEYKYMMCGFYALKLAISDHFTDFEITANETKYGNFDDISLKVAAKDTTRHFLLQLKHKEDVKKHLTAIDFSGLSNDFSFFKYINSFEETDAKDATLILYTNRKTRMKDGYEFAIQAEKGKEEWLLIRARKAELDFSNQGDIFQFDIIQDRTGFKKVAQFFNQFFLVTNQMDINSVRERVRQILTTLLNQDIYDLFGAFLRNWWLGRFVLTKHDVVAKVAELALKPWTRTLSSEKLNPKSEILAKSIMRSQMTIVQDSDIVDKIWDIGKVGNKYGVSGGEAWWYLGKAPLVVILSQDNQNQVTRALHFLGKCKSNKKIVLVGQVEASQFPSWTVLEYLATAPDEDFTNFKLSLQGRDSIDLHQLLSYDPEIANIVSIKELLQMSQNDLVVGLEGERKLPEAYIPRMISNQNVEISVTEDQVFEHFTSHLNIFSAPPGTGKSTLFQTLSGKYCPRDCWSVYVPLTNYNTFLRTKPSSEDILRHFCQIQDYKSFSQKLKRRLLKIGKVHMFLDGVDELESSSQNVLLDFVKKLSSQNIHLWLSSRQSLDQKIDQILKQESLVIEEVDKKQQQDYIHNRLTGEYKEDELDKIMKVVFSSSDITNSRQLLGLPLQLFIITEIFRNNRSAYDSLNEGNIFLLTKMYRLFFEGKKFHYRNIGVEEDQVGTSFEHHLRQYEILGLKSCLDRDHFERLGISKSSYQDFLSQIKENGDKYGIILKIGADDQIVFNHQTYAEYFASVWFKSNEEKLRLLCLELFSKRYENLKLIFDILMAEDNPLHLATIHKNTEQFGKHVNDSHRRDQGDRTALHIICSHGSRFPEEPYWHFKHGNQDNVDYITSLQTLLEKGNIFEVDRLFGFNALDYSLMSRCLFPLEKMLELGKISTTDLNKLLSIENSEYYRCLAFYCVRFRYPHLLSILLQEKTIDINDEVWGCYDLLDIALKSDQKGKIIQVLKHFGPNINTVDQHGWTRFQKALDSGGQLNLRTFLDLGADMEIVDRSGRNVLHYAARSSVDNDEIIRKLIEGSVELNLKDLIGQTPLHVASESGLEKNLKCFLELGADVTIVDNRNRTALHCAAESFKENPQVIEMLIKYGDQMNHRNCDSQSPLHVACLNGRLRNAEKLLELGADVAMVDDQNRNALHFAAASGAENEELIELLVRNGVKINERDSRGQSPLHVACLEGRAANVKKLLELGADVDAVDFGRRSIADYARWSRKEKERKVGLIKR